MAKARSRAAARKIKDKWKAKKWYNVLAPPSFENATIAETLADDPSKLMNRVTEVSMQDLTNDFRKSHVKLYFKIHGVEDTNAHTHYIGHAFTSDYLRRMVRRRRSKIDGVFDVTTRDGAVIRVKPIATTEKRIQNSQKKLIRAVMRKIILEQGSNQTLSDFVKYILDGRISADIYKACKQLYPLKRIEVYKTQVLSLPTIQEEPVKKKEKTEEETESKTEEETTAEETEETEEKSEEEISEKVEEKKNVEEQPEKTEEAEKEAEENQEESEGEVSKRE